MGTYSGSLVLHGRGVVCESTVLGCANPFNLNKSMNGACSVSEEPHIGNVLGMVFITVHELRYG